MFNDQDKGLSSGEKSVICFSLSRLAQFQTYLLTVPRRMNLPDALVTGRAVLAVRGVLMACSIVPGRPDCVLGLTNPVIGRPDCVIGLEFRTKK